MDKKKFLVLSSCLITSVVFAQPYTFAPQTQQSAGKGSPQQASVLSTSDLNDQVNQITAKKQAAYDQTFSQRISQLKAQTQLQAHPPAAGSTQPQTPASTGYPGDQNTASPPSTAVAVPAPPPANANVYTGFGGTTGNTNNSPAPSQQGQPKNSGGSWNVRY